LEQLGTADTLKSLCYDPQKTVSLVTNGLSLILDLDGVIVDSNPVHAEAWVIYAKRFGIDLDENAPQRIFGRRNDEIIRHFFGDHLSRQEVLVHGAAKEALYRKIMKDQLARRLVPGVRSFLEKHKATPIGLATNAEKANVDFVLDEAGIRDYFQVTLNGDQVKRPKPDPEIYLLSARLLNTQPENCVIFEDSFTGVEAALAAGARVVGVTTTYSAFPRVSPNIENFLYPELEPWLHSQIPVN
jgi:beta-phosphoglucomutase